MWIKIRTLMAAMLFMQKLPLGEAMDPMEAEKIAEWLEGIENNAIKGNQANQNFTSIVQNINIIGNFIKSQPDIMENAWYIIIIVILICLCNFVRRQIRKSKLQPRLCFNLSGNEMNVILQGQTFVDFSSNYVFEANSVIKGIKMEGCSKRKLVIEWDLAIIHKPSDCSIEFKNKIRVPWSTRNKIKQLKR